jgi:hypothetical protein
MRTFIAAARLNGSNRIESEASRVPVPAGRLGTPNPVPSWIDHRELRMNYQPLGSHGPQVSALGLGTMGMSDMYGPADRSESIATIHAALAQGVTLLDTGDFYGMGHNEMLVGEALKGGDRGSFAAMTPGPLQCVISSPIL